MPRIVQRLRGLLPFDTLQAKLQIAISGLMVASLAISVITFAGSTNVTQTRILRAETEAETARIIEALQARVSAVDTATQLLAQDPAISEAIQENSEMSLEVLNARAVLVRDRFEVGLVQIYNADGDARANLLLASLYRESSLIDQVTPGKPTVYAIGDHLILLCRADLPDGLGTVITGIDVEQALDDLVRQHRISADVGLTLSSVGMTPPKVSTRDGFPFDARQGRGRGYYSQHTALTLGDSAITLILVRSTEEIRSLTTSGLTVMIIASTLTTAALISGSIMLTRAIAGPIHELSQTAGAIARGDFTRRVAPTSSSLMKIGDHDEIGRLTMSFNQMVSQLQDLYDNLEARVAARTLELATAAEIARTVSSSLDLKVILHQTTRSILRRLDADIVAAYTVNVDGDLAVLEQVAGEGYPLSHGATVALPSNTSVGTAGSLHTTCVITDTEKNTQYLATWYPHMRSIVTVPMLASDHVIGVLEVQSATPKKFSRETVDLLGTLADQIATGIQNAHRYGDEQRRRRFTEVLELTGRILSGSLDIDKLPGRALSSLRALVNYERGSLWMVDGDRLVPMAQYGYIDERMMHRKKLTVAADIYAQLTCDHRPLIIDDLTTTQWKQKLWLKDDRSWMGVPIVTAKGEMIGVICLAGSEEGTFIAEDAVWVQAFASQAGIALENAYLYTELAALHQSSGSSEIRHGVSQ